MNVSNRYENSDTKDLLSAREVSEQYPWISRGQVWRWSREKKIPTVELPSGRKLFPRAAIEKMLTPTMVSGSSAPSASSPDDIPSSDDAHEVDGDFNEPLPGFEGLS
ncbi:MAG: hypothetical protein QM705_11040 [Ancrocorticia sp.]